VLNVSVDEIGLQHAAILAGVRQRETA